MKRIAIVLLILAAPPLAAQRVVLSPGAATDCNLGYGPYVVRQDVTVPSLGDGGFDAHFIAGRLRWGPLYGAPGGDLYRCKISEAEGALSTFYEQLHGLALGTLTAQDASDLGLVVGWGLQIEREYCATIGPCARERAAVMVKDHDRWSTGRAPGGGHPLACPEAVASEAPCGVQQAWNCFWRHTTWVDNRAPGCGVDVPPEPPSPPVDPSEPGPPVGPPPACPSCPSVECNPFPPPELARARRMCESWMLTPSQRAAACAHWRALQAYRPCERYEPELPSTGRLDMILRDEDGRVLVAP